jgi:hypothetical protein
LLRFSWVPFRRDAFGKIERVGQGPGRTNSQVVTVRHKDYRKM